MTWAVVGRLLAADGGFGAMNRDLGANPDPALGSLSAFDLVARFAGRDVPLIRARMHRDPGRARRQAHPHRVEDAWHRAAARIAQRRHLVHVHTEANHDIW